MTSNSRRRPGRLLMAAGTILLLSAIIITVYNITEELRAEKTAYSILSKITARLGNTDNTPETSGVCAGEIPEYILDPYMEMPAEEIDGNEYIGILDIPSLDISLPVMSQWSYAGLKISPCRYSGSVYLKNMVIAAHNYRAHFGTFGSSLADGAQIIFTDMKGNSFFYKVVQIETIKPTAIDDMISEEWDLTLFTCTPDAASRLAVRCVETGFQSAVSHCARAYY